MTSPAEFTSDFARFAAALDGQYALECEIGRGGMGVVYLARDLRLDRRVAIKTLPPHLANDSVVRERFLREARTAARLSHQNIVPIHRADEIGGHVFFVMGYVDGDSMAQRVRDRGCLDPRDVVRELRDVAEALSYAHQHGVIHRDIKAENILIDRASGRAMVTDFGIARLAQAAPLTATGQVLGTVYYLSPEQVSGEPVDGRSDIYALGVAGFFALSARFPFDAELASAVLIAHVNKSPPPLHSLAPHVPRALADVVDRCLAKEPSARFQTGDDLASNLARIVAIVDRETDERAATGQPASRSPLISDTEAQSIIGRAADLQALTGVQVQPTLVPGVRDVSRDAARTSGHRATNVRDAAVEAGISAKYVDRAMIEHGLAETNAPVPVSDHSRPGNAFIGAPTRLDFEIVLAGEMPESDFDLLVEVIRQATGEAGQITTVGRSFSWQGDPRKNNIQVSVLPRAGKTRIRVSDTLGAAAGGIFGGLIGGVGGGTLPVWLGMGLKMGDFGAGMLAWTATTALTYLASRGLFALHSRSRAGAVRALSERLAAQARESIDYAKPKLGSG
jgi:serine/threonine protein kinase